jgi:hypothetical protein
MIRNILLASLISTFCYFGALGAKDTRSTLTCLAVAFIAWGLCIWRCMVLNRRISERNQRQRMFNEYMRATWKNHRFD